MTTTADKICWERPSDAEETWFYDDYLCPVPVATLTQSFYPYTTQAFPRNQREFWGRQGRLRTTFVAGYLYVNPEMGGRPPESALERARQSVGRWETEWLPEVKANLERLQALDLTAMAEDELARALQDALAVTMRHWQIEGQIDGPGLMGIRAFGAWYQQRFPDRPEHEPYRLLQGQMHAVLEAQAALWDLTQLLTPEVKAALKAGQPAPEPFRTALATFLERYGRRTEQMYDISSPTWLEEPALVVQRILRAAEEEMPDPREATAHQAAEADLLAEQVHRSLTPDETEAFEGLLARARAANRSKEEHKFWIEQLTPGAVRLICAELGRRMAEVGLLSDYTEVSYLTLAELIQFGFGLSQPHLGDLVAQRKAEHEQNRSVRPEPWLGANPDEETAQAPPEEVAELSGRGASPGVVIGRARVLATPSETATLQRGEILVCPWTDPDWTPLMAVASAIVTDTGGVLSHAAVVAREFGIPAVVATESATRWIKTGQLIRVDGNRGVVQLQV